ncbi:MAG TPA: FIST N-terminal domain-containing protein, partial [Tepidisphaeraceae bacterium]|nr:FIST N-terminal domain-containing protein [Tepidisphaeraceae bacterium]
MRFHAAVSEQDSALAALADVLDEARESLEAEPDVAFLFFTGHHLEDADALVERAWRELEPQALVGCSAEGVIGADREVERKPGLALLVGSLPGVRVHAFHVAGDDWHDVLSGEEEFVERVGCGPETRCVVGFGDPFSTPINQLLPAFDQWAAGAPLVGGMASAARQPGGNALVCNDASHDGGFVGLSVSGPLSVETVVSQGCRPVGRPLVITRARENVIEQLGGRPAMEALRATVAE